MDHNNGELTLIEAAFIAILFVCALVVAGAIVEVNVIHKINDLIGWLMTL